MAEHTYARMAPRGDRAERTHATALLDRSWIAREMEWIRQEQTQRQRETQAREKEEINGHQH